jgi:hypothetical protein
MDIMPACRLIFCEKSSHFAPVVRAELASESPRVVETRSLAGCQAELAAAPHSLLAIEATPTNLPAVTAFLAQLGKQYPQAAAVALLACDDTTDNPPTQAAALLAEAGAVAVFQSVLEASRLAKMARHMAALAEPEELPVSEFVAQRLPWPAHATNPNPPSFNP